MNIAPVVEILALAVLLFIAAELYIIARELSRGVSFLIKEREGRDGREVQNAGQTINVNLAPTGATVPAGAAVPAGTAVPAGLTSAVHSATIAQAGGTSLQEAQAAAKAPAEEPGQKSVPSGQFAVKCSRCQAENSSYRHECFNCGGPL